MHFNVSQLMKEHSGSRRTYEAKETMTLLEDAPLCQVRGTVKLLRTDRGVWVSAALGSEVVCACSRCLAGCEQSIHVEIEEEFFPLVDIATGARTRFPQGEEEGARIDQNHILDLSEAVRQYASLAVPMGPVCREDCAGICLGCGANLNENACACEGAGDPRRETLLHPVLLSDENH